MDDWSDLVREHGPAVYRAAWRVLGDAAAAEDAVQDAFLSAWQRQAFREPVRNWTAYLCQLVTWRALDMIRRRGAACELTADIASANHHDPQSVLVEKELAVRLRHALTMLSDREAQVFSLRFFADLSNQEVAEVLDITVGAVGVALHKARQRLQELLKPEE